VRLEGSGTALGLRPGLRLRSSVALPAEVMDPLATLSTELKDDEFSAWATTR
jgi:hypothetical protein